MTYEAILDVIANVISKAIIVDVNTITYIQRPTSFSYNKNTVGIETQP